MAALRVLINGAKGRMGREVVQAVRAESDLEIAAETDLGDDLGAAIGKSGAAVVVDFTHPSSARKNTETVLRAGACPVVGTTGFRPEDVASLQALALELGRGGVIAPNFALGAVLLMKFAAAASRYFPDVEVIELHHDQKVDAPSGTAMKTIEAIHAARGAAAGERRSGQGASVAGGGRVEEHIAVEGARGGLYLGIRVHSVRLPGYVAHQEVLFGGVGQTLTLRHDAPLRSAFMPGVILAVRKAPALDRLHYGLESILEI